MNAIENFGQAMRDHGVEPPAEIIADGKLHRYTLPGDKPRSNNGWYILHLDFPENGKFGYWKGSIHGEWKGQNQTVMTAEERRVWQERATKDRQKREKETAERREKCRKSATELWEKADRVKPDHPYLKAKAVGAYGLKQDGETLLLPVRDAQGTLHGLQTIYPDGSKWFMSGTAVAGCYHTIGKPDGRILVTEGYATGATLHHITGDFVACAFNAGNLKPVAEALRERFPEGDIVICADDDHAVNGNPGLTKANEAAHAVGGTVIVPVFPDSKSPKDTDFNDMARIAGPDAVKACIAEAAVVASQEDGGIPERPLFMSGTELVAGSVTVNYLVHKLIQRDTIGLLFGPSGGGKTFVALDIALCVATGTPCDGRETKQGLVLYLAGEGHGGLHRRVKAWMTRHGWKPQELSLLHISRGSIGLDGSGVLAVTAEAKKLSETHGMPVVLIVIDTLARHIEGDENSATDMGEFIKAVDSVRRTFSESVAIIVHHTGHGEDARKRARGSSALKAAMDFEFRCSDGVLTFSKMKDGDMPSPIEFKLTPHVIGTDDAGDPITSCTVQYGERAQRHRQAETSESNTLAITALRKASHAGDGQGVGLEEWRKAFYRLRQEEIPKPKKDTMRKSFNRATESLNETGAVANKDDRWFLSSPDLQRDNGTCPGHVPPYPLGIEMGHGTHSSKECPDVPLPVPPLAEIEEELDFDLSSFDPAGNWE